MTNQETKENIIRVMKEDPVAARTIWADYWFEWDTFGGDHYEGVILEIDNGTLHILCTDGKERAV